MSPKDEIIKIFNELSQILGIDPILVTLFIALLLSAYVSKDIKNWKEVSSFQKNMDISIWVAFLGFAIALIIKYIRGD